MYDMKCYCSEVSCDIVNCICASIGNFLILTIESYKLTTCPVTK